MWTRLHSQTPVVIVVFGFGFGSLFSILSKNPLKPCAPKLPLKISYAYIHFHVTAIIFHYPDFLGNVEGAIDLMLPSTSY